ncbi:unnamed protein product [Diabrotica balteata]|uniref:XK-related protein n=1 Tax=Diabrotica balteata TaxID=107213 RepID=A0A9P0DW86_DIABA|nr:unnamed protein product [Diabrotica balteata]
MVTGGNDGKKQTLLGYELTSCEDAIVNYLVPSVSACILYILLIAVDVGVIFSHFKNDDPIWASLTLFILYVPALISFVLVVSNWALWPEFESCGRENMIWFWTKLGEHFFFPVWSIWRFAERIFWSIEAVRAKDEQSFEEAVSIITSPRSIELYVFLQSYTHALPQVLLQLYILTRNNTEMNRQTEKVQTLCLVLNLLKLAVTTTYYQRFKSQKLTGKQYPWYKRHKDLSLAPNSTNEVVLRKPIIAVSRLAMEIEGRFQTFKRYLANERGFGEKTGLYNYIIEMQELGFGLTVYQIRKYAYDLAKVDGREKFLPSTNCIASKWWWNSFKSRYNLCLRVPENLSAYRASMANEFMIKDFFSKLNDVLTKLNIKNTPKLIWNCDETGLSYVVKPSKVNTGIGKKYVFKRSYAERGQTQTMLACICADGTWIPPMVIFKSVTWNDTLKNDAPPSTMELKF